MSIRFFRVIELPSQPQPDAIYFIGNIGSDQLIIAATSQTGQVFSTGLTISEEQVNVAFSTKVDKVEGKTLSQVNFTQSLLDHLNSIEDGATVNLPDIELLNRSNQTGTQPISTVIGLQDALNSKVTVISGKVLSSNDFTNALKTKLDGIEAGATVNSTDAVILARSTNTGDQPISTVTDLQTELDKRVEFHFGSFVTNSTELQNAQNETPDQSQIFASWLRISNGTNGVFPSNSNELSAWTYDSAAGLIKNTTNSVTFVGVVSEKSYDNYKLLVRLASNSNDDDYIGIIIAFDKDADGREYTLTCGRSPGGMSPLWGWSYNYGQGATYGAFNTGGNGLVTWGNNADGKLTGPQAGYVSNSPGWGNMGAFQGTDGSVLVQVERIGDIITIMTSQWSTPSVLDPNTKMTIDLSTNALLQRFRGPRRYGFGAQSQQNSTWKTLEFTNPKDAILDLATSKAYTYNGSSWVVNSQVPVNYKPGSVLVNQSTGKVILAQQGGTTYAVYNAVKQP